MGLDHRHLLWRGPAANPGPDLGFRRRHAALGRIRHGHCILRRTDFCCCLIAGIIFSIAFRRSRRPPLPPAKAAVKDPGFVVIDEVAGQWIALLGSPADWKHGLIALILFRLFDITKPFPAANLERLPEGWGIVFDDVAAGLYALGVASLLRLWI